MKTATYVPVRDAAGNALEACHPGKARILCARGRAAPDTEHDIYGIRLVDKIVPAADIRHSAVVAVDPGAEHTGIAVYRQNGRGQRTVLLTMQIEHRGRDVRQRNRQRSGYRRGRRCRLWRRPARFLNRKRAPGWLSPSLLSRKSNSVTWTNRVAERFGACRVAVETAKFDPQRMQNPEIHGKQYQQGPLYQKTQKGYVMERDGDRCRYCGKPAGKRRKLTLDHVEPQARGGSDAPYNIVAACERCNAEKGDRPVAEFLASKGWLDKLPGIMAQVRKQVSTKAATHTNVIIPHLVKELRGQGWRVSSHDAAQTAANRERHGVVKSHANDAAVLGDFTAIVNLPPPVVFLAIGHGRRQRITPNKHGTPDSEAWPGYCRDRDLGRELPKQIPGHKLRPVRFPNAGGVSTGDRVEITNRNGTYVGEAMMTDWGTRVALRGSEPRITGAVETARVLQRSHGYWRVRLPRKVAGPAAVQGVLFRLD